MFDAFGPSESLFPTETIRPMESLSDGGIIIEWFPTETTRPMESLVVDWLAEDHVDPSDPSIGFFPTETIRPMESLLI